MNGEHHGQGTNQVEQRSQETQKSRPAQSRGRISSVWLKEVDFPCTYNKAKGSRLGGFLFLGAIHIHFNSRGLGHNSNLTREDCHA